jgi:hypothetical protein
VNLFNWISGRISRFVMGLTNAGSELADRLECSDSPSPVEKSERRREATPSEELQTASAA